MNLEMLQNSTFVTQVVLRLDSMSDGQNQLSTSSLSTKNGQNLLSASSLSTGW